MSKNLVIVESPAKARTIEAFLGPDFLVRATFGHVRDLPTKELGIDINQRFTPDYQIIPKAKKVISQLKKLAEGADTFYLATDYDREGEAIAWHILQALGLKDNNQQPTTNNQPKKLTVDSRQSAVAVRRITFHEITKTAITDAVKNPRSIDMNLVDAQQARRVLDRLVGYKLSPFLWKKVLGGLSAGRVQSVAVRLIVDREREIEAFKPQEYWTLIANLVKLNNDQSFEATLSSIEGKTLDKLAIGSEQEAKRLEQIFQKGQYTVGFFDKTEQRKYPFPPFTTSTLQQDVNRRLGFSSKKTMRLAQDLYEQGKITYMRTDSTNLSWLAINTARKYLEHHYGKDYVPKKPRFFKTKTLGAQEAHEAIRPTYIETETLKGKSWTDDHLTLYQLIRNRMLACQATEAVLEVTNVEVTAKVDNATIKEGRFSAAGQRVVFDGFMKLYPISIQQKELPSLAPKEPLKLLELTPKQHFTKPPDRYSEATLVKELEQQGIGRPSTYAPTISTIQDRGYVYLQQRFFYPREIGTIVTDLLVKHFPDIVDVGFTAQMEENLDEIAEGKKQWVTVVGSFYDPFAKQLQEKEKTVERVSFAKEESGEQCPKCGKQMIVKVSRYGKFLACSGYPACKTTKYLPQTTGIKCPECHEGEVVERQTRKHRIFWGCSRYPDCKYASWTKPTVGSHTVEG